MIAVIIGCHSLFRLKFARALARAGLSLLTVCRSILCPDKKVPQHYKDPLQVMVTTTHHSLPHLVLAGTREEVAFQWFARIPPPPIQTPIPLVLIPLLAWRCMIAFQWFAMMHCRCRWKSLAAFQWFARQVQLVTSVWIHQHPLDRPL